MSHRSRLLHELKRRKVFRVAVVYAATAFVVLQAADLLTAGLRLPDWVFPVVTVLLILGFPVALVLAWALELTPDGLRKTGAMPDAGGAGAPSVDAKVPAALGRRTLVVAAALVLVGLGLGAGWFLKPIPDVPESQPRPGMAEQAPEPRSLAVLPFTDLSEARDQQWFAEGLTEEILTALARVPELRVIARGSSFRFAADQAADRIIADTLGVAHLVKGSVRRIEDQLRVTAQLVRASDGVQLWSGAYDGGTHDLFDVQRDVAEKVAAALDVLLDDARRERMFATGTRNVEAFEAFLRGREIYDAAHAGDRAWTLGDANEWFERAMALDPGFARPAILHGDRYAHIAMDGPDVSFVGPHDLSAEEAIERLRSDFDHAARGAADPYARIVAEINREFFAPTWHRLPGLIDELRSQMEMGHPLVDAVWEVDVLLLTGQLELARELTERILRADPLDPVAWSRLVQLEIFAGDLGTARALLAEARHTAGDHPYHQGYDRWVIPFMEGDRTAVLANLAGLPDSTGPATALAAALRGDVQAAREHAYAFEAALDWPSPALLIVYHELGDRERSRELVRRIDARPAGPAILTREVTINWAGLIFDPADAPNFSARLAEAGVDPGFFRTIPRLSDGG